MSASVVVEADGGSRGNPGPAGYGAVVKDAASGAVLAERAESIGVATNNVAEYRGLIAGLTAARDLHAVQVRVWMDSKLVIEQMSGRWQIKHPDMRPLARQANELRREFDTITFEWIPRERNAHADRLANEAMDAAAGIVRTKRTPATAPPARPEVSAPVLLRDAVLLAVDADAAPLATLLGRSMQRPTHLMHTPAVTAEVLDGRHVVLVQDVVTTGTAMLAAVDGVRAAGALVETALCLVDRQQGGRSALAAKGVALRALLTAADLA